MAHGPVAIGAVVAAAILALVAGSLAAVALRGAGGWPGPADWVALRFTLGQAALSAVLSVALAVPVARALARRRFPGRAALISLMGAPFLLPVIVAVLGLIAVFGRQGWFNDALAVLGLPRMSVYGLHGVVLAHVFLNLPLAVRMVLMGWQAIPAERLRLAASLDFGPVEMFRHLERPMLRAVLPGAALAVFLICLTSFAVALTLGGGPGATTVELAIYQALRFEFDPGRAAVLALMQVALGGAAVLAAARVTVPAGFGPGLDRLAERHDARTPWLRAQDAVAIGAAAAFLLGPLAAVVWRGLPGLVDLPAAVWPAAARSVAVAAVSTALTLAAAVALARAVVAGARWVELAGMLPLALSGLALGTGLFLIVHPFVAPERLALPVTALVNALLSLPFALRLILPALREIEASHGRLADSLGLTGRARLLRLVLPRLRRPLGLAAGLVVALAMGDLGVIALFAGEAEATLPLIVHRLMGAYRMQAAAGAALVLVALSFALFFLCDRWGRGDAAA
ncbi:MAG: thiamine/thiamine pyrophosphate ABC transporter permease ThiP [Rhodobacterales bacterium]|nr:thiamine/thiamine pyrophosphate ABC transporter permease ThiP [Rhodobacterales bacterium]